jgi:hypothetical protein
MHGTYVDYSGDERDCDLDTVKVLARGVSGIRKGWSGLLAWVPEHNVVVEFRSSVPDIRGNSLDEASQVDRAYAAENYGLAAGVLNTYL